ncbi:MAG TPA: pitrilysin family protein, partial [candidate division Zixibacteria bacterium]|nr:pitrilysin family protein [candidate division Zixibacteria bacterium]
GSKNEKPRRTGFAHLFEHMMFQGSEHQPGEFFAPLEKVGGSGNGSTNEDRTNYYENVPSNYLELALWLEADRMAYLLPAMDLKKLDNQRDVVKNERRQGYENEPYGKIEALMPELLYPSGHPYSWPVIGSHEDLTAASLEDVKDFFRTYYTPSNASLCITGDFEPAKAKALVQKYFGGIVPGTAVERLKDWPVSFDGEKRVTVPDRVSLPRLYYVWHTPPFYAPGDAELDLLANILTSGKTSRLYKSLVYDRQIAQDVTAYQASRQIGSEFRIMVTAKAGVSQEEIERAVDEELAKIRSKGVSSQEFSQAQNNWEAFFVRQLENVGGRSDLLNQYNFFLGDPDKLSWDMNRYLGTTAAAVKETAQKYLDPNRRLAAWVVPQPDYRAEKSTVDFSKMPSPAKEPTFTPPKVQKGKLSNGMEVWLAEEHKLPLVQMQVVVKSGWAGDPKGKPGAAALTAALLDEGTRSRSALEISSEAKILGAQLSTSSFFDGSTATLNVLKKNFDGGLDLLADVVQNPVFPAEELERQRQIYLGRIMQESKEPVASAIKAFQKALFGENHPYSQPYTGSGTEASVKAIQRDDLVNYYETYYAANNATIVAAGDVTMDELLPKLEKAFGNWEQKEVPAVNIPPGPAIRGSKVVLVDKPGAAQSVIALARPGVERSSPDYYALQVMNTILGGSFSSRLNQNLRETKGWTYGAGSGFAYRPVPG